MKLSKNQVGARKEAALLITAGRESHGSDQARIYVPTDAEYAYYYELLEGYFETLKRWLDIFKEFKEDTPDKRHPENAQNERYVSDFLVIQTPEGRALRTDPREVYEYQHNPDIVLLGSAWRIYDPINNDYRKYYDGGSMSFRPGIAGKHLLVDIENIPVNDVDIAIYSIIPKGESSINRTLKIITDLTDYNPGKGRRVYGRSKYVAYEFQENTLHILRGKGGAEPMSDAYATHLFETIDELIPRSTSPTPQPVRRPTPELRAPGLLTAPRRRRPAR